VTDVGAFQTQLAARENSLKAKIIFLKEQFHARVFGDEPRVYTSLGPEFRTKHGKLRLTAQNKNMTEVAYLTSLLNAMMEEDGDAIGLNANKDEHNLTTLTLNQSPTLTLTLLYRTVQRTIYSYFANTLIGLLQPWSGDAEG
jgi:hypothetical protein